MGACSHCAYYRHTVLVKFVCIVGTYCNDPDLKSSILNINWAFILVVIGVPYIP